MQARAALPVWYNGFIHRYGLPWRCFSLSKHAQQPDETPRAAEAFSDYVGLGSARSLEALVSVYRTYTKPAPTKHLRTLKDWSAKFRWQARIVEAATAETDRKLHRAAEMDAETFFKSSEKLHNAIEQASDPRDIISIRESVRKPVAKGATHVNVSLDIQIAQVLDQIAEVDGLTPDERREFEAEVKEYLSEVRT